MDDDTFIRAHLARTEQIIEERGWAQQHVLGGAGEPAFTYTVGLHRAGLPELIVFGPPDDVAAPMLDSVAWQLRQGRAYVDGDVVDGRKGDQPVRVMEVLDSRTHLLHANALSPSPLPVPALQLIYPDRDGRWPWQPGSRIASVPLLGIVPDLGPASPGRR